jgi:threonine synthase
MTYLSHLECSECGQTYSAHELYNLRKKCGAPLWVRYDLDRARQELDRGWLTSHEKIVSLNTGAWWKNP